MGEQQHVCMCIFKNQNDECKHRHGQQGKYFTQEHCGEVHKAFTWMSDH